MKGLSIGRVAKQVGVSVDAVRLYERYGLIEAPLRAGNGYRCYREQDIARLQFIKRAKGMGFALKEIGELLAIKSTSKHTCNEVRQQVEHKLNVVQHKLAELKQLSIALQTLVHLCDESQTDRECPILDALEQQGNMEVPA